MVSIKTLCLQITPSKVYLLRFILEGYDNLFVLSTLDREKGLVEIQYCQSAREELFDVLQEIQEEIGLSKME